jgi:hypothetical protein
VDGNHNTNWDLVETELCWLRNQIVLNSLNSLFAMQMHTPDSGSVAVECVQALAIFRIPDFQGAVGAAADDDGTWHLRGPNSANVTHQHSQTLLVQKKFMKKPRILGNSAAYLSCYRWPDP